jgi:hypothetical protein
LTAIRKLRYYASNLGRPSRADQTKTTNSPGCIVACDPIKEEGGA